MLGNCINSVLGFVVCWFTSFSGIICMRKKILFLSKYFVVSYICAYVWYVLTGITTVKVFTLDFEEAHLWLSWAVAAVRKSRSVVSWDPSIFFFPPSIFHVSKLSEIVRAYRLFFCEYASSFQVSSQNSEKEVAWLASLSPHCGFVWCEPLNSLIAESGKEQDQKEDVTPVLLIQAFHSLRIW